jgi:photosystem II stability/assembly factor-like uncharacterized protein
MTILVATRERLFAIEPGTAALVEVADLPTRRLTCLAADPLAPGRAWCGTPGDGLRRGDDGGRSWHSAGLAGEEISAVSASPGEPGRVWVGSEPSALWRSGDGGGSCQQAPASATTGDGCRLRRLASARGLRHRPLRRPPLPRSSRRR